MFNNYINNFGFLQVTNNVIIKNYYEADFADKVFNDVREKTEEKETSDISVVIDWDLAEDEEENINDPKQKFLPSKLKTLKLENIYLFQKNYSKAFKLHQCGSYLEFLISRGATIDKKKLKKINSCKLRFCPFCAWRRSLRIFSNVLKCYNYIEAKDKGKGDHYKSRFVFLTLTTKNVKGEDLKREIDNILDGFRRFRQYKAFENAFLGFVRALEVTRDREPIITQEMYSRKKDYYKKINLSVGDENPNYLFFNVHIHVLAHTTYRRYQENYLEQSVVSELWQKALKIDYVPVVDIRSFKAKSRETKGRELAEIAKYTVKPTDYLKADFQSFKSLKQNPTSEFLLDVDTISFLDEALSGRRLFEYAGTFREAFQELKLDDDKMVDDIEAGEAEKYILKYYFSFKNKLYRRIKD